LEILGENSVEDRLCELLGAMDNGLRLLCMFHSSIQRDSVGALPANTWPSPGGSSLTVFILFVADALSMVLQHEVKTGGLKELKVSRNAPGVSHLLFADDAHLFFEANKSQGERIKQVLQLFQTGTGQLLSSSKCSLLTQESLDRAVQE